MSEASQTGLYAPRTKIHPKSVKGRFRRWKDVIGTFLVTIYFAAPWLRWERPGDAPDQAILMDMPNRRGYLFDIDIWPQDIVYLAPVLILGTVALFMTAAVAGRVWCGFACPQTVFTDIFIRLEKLWEGDRAERIRLDKEPWTSGKIVRRGGKHLSWILVSLLFAATFSFYFVDAPEAVAQYLTLNAGTWMWTTIIVLGSTTYLLAAFTREQFCNYMCPWPRIQSSMLDDHSLIVTYQKPRGDAKAPLRKSQSLEERRTAGFGDCVSCMQCVQVCPIGIDIREGANADCINCGLCIDACDTIMDKVGFDRGLIRFDSLANGRARAAGAVEPSRAIRPKTVIFASVLALVGAGVLTAFLMRSDTEITLIQERSPLFVPLSDGSIRNAYQLKILNKRDEALDLHLSLDGVAGAEITLLGDTDGDHDLGVDRGGYVSQKVFVTVPPGTELAEDLVLNLETVDGEVVARRHVPFALP